MYCADIRFYSNCDITSPTNTNIGYLAYDSLTSSRTYKLPDANGTIALLEPPAATGLLYYGLVVGSNTKNWLRATVNGIIPYANNTSYIGTSTWRFIGVYAGNVDASGNITGNKLYSVDGKTATTTAAPNCYITSNGCYVGSSTTSSKRFKDNISMILCDELNPDRLYDINVVQFKYKEDYFVATEDIRYRKNLIGFIVEDIYEKYPIAADYHYDEDTGNIMVDGWNQQYMIPAMLKLIQEQNERIKVLEKQLQIKYIP